MQVMAAKKAWCHSCPATSLGYSLWTTVSISVSITSYSSVFLPPNNYSVSKLSHPCCFADIFILIYLFLSVSVNPNATWNNRSILTSLINSDVLGIFEIILGFFIPYVQYYQISDSTLCFSIMSRPDKIAFSIF